jgi:hypothetical protein
MSERWKAIEDPANISHAYISNRGRVRYLNSRGQWKTTIGSPQNGKYLQVKLGHRKFCVHLLVAKQWLVKKCRAFRVVHHKDANRQNNTVENIEWTTQLLNCSLRTNSSMCVQKKGRYVSKFIFGGKIQKSSASYDTALEAREEALKMRQKMYASAYQALILNEQETTDVAGEQTVTTKPNAYHTTVCV